MRPVRLVAGTGSTVVVASVLWSAALVASSWHAAAPHHRAGVEPPRYADGAPPGFSGGFGEQSCHACHFDETPNAAPGSVTIEGLPQAYVPGETYRLTVTLTRPGMALGGFQLTARLAGTGDQAGTLGVPPDESARVRIEQHGDVQYAGQRPAAAPTSPDASSTAWTLDWLAPDATETAVFHAAANAADRDESASGDFVYTTMNEVPAAPVPRR